MTGARSAVAVSCTTAVGGARPAGCRSASGSPSRCACRKRCCATAPTPRRPAPSWSEAKLALRDRAEIGAARPLRALSLRGAALARSRVPTDVVRVADHRLARTWAAAFHQHPSGLDGLLFPSRLRTGDSLALLHGRVRGALRSASRRASWAAPSSAAAPAPPSTSASSRRRTNVDERHAARVSGRSNRRRHGWARLGRVA